MSSEQRMTRRRFLGVAATVALAPNMAQATALAGAQRARQAVRPVPSAPQLLWQRDELALFIHFGVNTFTNREWGDGRESPSSFAPAQLDARQWARAARAAGFRAMVLTAKHHDGFCLWPSRTTQHSVAQSPWRNGGGDLVREFVDACRAEGLRPGLYCSPWDRNHPSYGDSPRYNDVYCDQLTELLTNYGPIHEVWFDGANGEGPNGKRQVYDWPRVWQLVRRLQPDAVMFSDAGPDIRWIGNESGVAGETNWSTVNPAIVPVPGLSGAEVMRSLQQGDRDGTVWRPGETDVSIRPGWFYHPAEDGRVKSVSELVDIYFTSVGRNSKLLLNVPPTTAGLLHDVDVSRLAGLRTQLDELFRNQLTAAIQPLRHTSASGATVFELDLGRTTTITIADLREDIARGQSVARYMLDGLTEDRWFTIAQGTTIGYRKLHRFRPTPVRQVLLTVLDATGPVEAIDISLYG